MVWITDYGYLALVVATTTQALHLGLRKHERWGRKFVRAGGGGHQLQDCVFYIGQGSCTQEM